MFSVPQSFWQLLRTLQISIYKSSVNKQTYMHLVDFTLGKYKSTELRIRVFTTRKSYSPWVNIHSDIDNPRPCPWYLWWHLCNALAVGKRDQSQQPAAVASLDVDAAAWSDPQKWVVKRMGYPKIPNIHPWHDPRSNDRGDRTISDQDYRTYTPWSLAPVHS